MGKSSRRKEISINETPTGRERPEKESNPSQESPSKEKLYKTTSITALSPIAVLVIVSFAVYFNALFGDFVYDDMVQILGNQWIKDITNIPTIFSEGVWSFDPGRSSSNYYRPLMYFVYTLNYRLFGYNSWGFHLVNILFHCCSTVLVFLIVRRILSEYYRVSTSLLYLSPSFMAAMLFASHPIHTEAVTWIAGLPDVAYTFFYLLSFYFYVRSKAMQSVNYLFSLACFTVAAFFKEPALTLPVILLAYDYAFRKERTRFTDYMKKYIPFIIIEVGYLAMRVHVLGEFAPEKGHVTLSGYQYAINVSHLFIQYLGKLLLPVNLTAIYVFHPVVSFFDLKGIFSVLATVAFVVLFPLTLKKERVAFLALVVITVPLLPALYLPALGDSTFADRYLYLPSVGYVLLLAIFLSWAEEKLPRAAGSIKIGFMIVWALYSVGTITRNNVWQDNFKLWTDTVKKSIDSEKAHVNLGIAYASKGQLDLAIEEYETALRLKPDSSKAHLNLGIAYISKGQLDLAIEEYKTALRLKPDSIKAHLNLGVAYISKGQLDLAIEEYKTALRLKPDYAEAHSNLGLAYASKGQLDLAIEEYKTALRLKPDLEEAHYNLGFAYASKGQLDLAIEEYKTALRLKPDDREARQSLNDLLSARH